MMSKFFELRAIRLIASILIIALIYTDISIATDWMNDRDRENENEMVTPQLQGVRNSGSVIFKPGYGMMVSTLPDSISFLNQVYPIDDKGYVELPITGKLHVIRMTKSEVETYIKDKFQAYNRFGNVYVKPMLRVSLLGGFYRPGMYYVGEESSLWDVIKLAGGASLEDGLKNMRWERSRKYVKKDLIPLIQSGISLKEMGFRSGDQIWTPSPMAETMWDRFRTNVLPLLSFALSATFLYYSYEQTRLLRSERTTSDTTQ